jgi:hypothetical protein
LSFTQLSIWNNKFFSNNFRPTTSFVIFYSLVQQDLPYKRHAKSAFWGGCSNKILDLQTKAFCKVQRSCNKDSTIQWNITHIFHCHDHELSCLSR